MLSEEALILLAATGAVVLLVLGVLELVWPSKPRHPVRRAQAKPASPARQAPPPPAVPFARPTPAPTQTPPTASAKPTTFTKPVPPPVAPAASADGAPGRKRRSKVSPHARSHARGAASGVPGGASAVAGATPAAPPVARALEATGAPERPVVAEPATTPLDEVRPDVGTGPTGPDRTEGGPGEARDGSGTPVHAAGPGQPGRPLDPLLVETCFSLYQDRCYDEVIAVGEGALARVPTESFAEDDAHEIAALWSVVALARQAQGDDERARQALEAALAVAPAGERQTYRQHLAALSLNAAQALLARAGSHETEDRVGALRTALTWVEGGLAHAPADERLRAAAEAAQDALWPACEQTVNRLLQRQEFEAARRLLREALDDPRLPSAWVGDFQALLSGTFGGEIGQLTAQAIRSMQEERESEALGALQRAEELLATISAEALPPKRREEVDQRLWWGYTRLGMRRVEAGEYEEALDPLVHALRFADIGPDRQAETRAALVRALEGVAELRALGIRQLNDDGNRDEAVLRTEALRELLRSCMVLGVSEEELSVAFAKARRLGEELGMEDHA